MDFNPMSLSGKKILVTGASSGLGRETSIVLSKLGASVILVARNIERLEETRSKLEGTGHHVFPFNLDNLDAISDFFKRISAQSGPLSGLFHAAGIEMTVSIKGLKPRDMLPVFSTSIFSTLMLVKGFCQKGVRTDGPSSLVFMSSTASLTGTKGLSVYSSSKAAIDGAVRSLAVELANKQIRVNALAAGMIRSKMLETVARVMSPERLQERESQHPLGFGEPLDVALAVAFLLSESSKWITGTTMVVDGGFSISK